MAANSTLLAIQCAAGVAAPPRYLHLRKNLIAKTHKTTIMAANPTALQYEVGVPIFTPCQPHGTAVSTKRNKTIVAAYPTKVEITSGGIPLETVGEIENLSGRTISLNGKDIWKGSRTTTFPETIHDQNVGKFTHSADSKGEILGSMGALEYKLHDEIKWIIAWGNPIFQKNKVYTAILDAAADWEQIKENLEAEGQEKVTATDLGYSVELEIDPISATPTLKATVKSSNPPNNAEKKE